MKKLLLKVFLPILICTSEILGIIPNVNAQSVQQMAEVSGELKKWHKVTITFDGPMLSETSSSNPSLDYRLDVTFTNSSGKSYKVPGYFSADGNAAETGATSGNKWRVHFSPDQIGTWNYSVSFRTGKNIAVSDITTEGTALSPDGSSGSFSIIASNKTGVDLRSKGRIQYVGESLLKFAETGEYFRKVGTDAPENFLAYNDIDNTSNYNNFRKSWSPHIQDWRTGDPTWHNGTLGKGIIGAINYLSSRGQNSLAFLTMNIEGDDRNCWPYVDQNIRTQMDVSKLDQWAIIFDHAEKMGIHLHFKTQEIENNNLLDGGNLGVERKLYYRTLIARFGYHLGVTWNLGEENTQTTQQQKDMAHYFATHDPYHSAIDIHTFPNDQELRFRPLLGSASDLTGGSIQQDLGVGYSEIRKWIEASASAGKKWVVGWDEQGPADVGVAADANYTGNRGTVADNSDFIRSSVLWGSFMAGGSGVEYYYGYSTGETDLTLQDFRSRAKSYEYSNIAKVFFNTYFPTTMLIPSDNASSGWTLRTADNSTFVVYLKTGGTSSIAMPTGSYNVQWYNPRAGGSLQNGSITSISAGTTSIGYPPSDPSLDWVVLIRKTQSTNTPPTANAGTDKSITLPVNSTTLSGSGTDVDGTISSYSWSQASGPNMATFSPNNSIQNPTVSGMVAGRYVFTLGVTDNLGATSPPASVTIIVNPATSNNKAPVANAGAAQTVILPTNSVTLDGSASSDDDGTISSYSWSQTSGPNTATFSPSTAAQKPTISGLVAGTYVFALAVTDNLGAVSSTASVTITVSGSAAQAAVYRINAGGPEVTNSIGTFAADAYYSPAPGNTYSTTTAISGTADGEMYQTERFGSDNTLSYAFPVNNGSYNVVLHFAEIFWNEAGQRLFDVSIEGNKVLDDYDIFKKAGAFMATSETFTVNVTDGVLNIDFSSLPADGGVDQPKVSAIEVLTTAATQTITNFTLVNAFNNQDIQTLNNGATLNLATLPGLNIRANTSPATVGSVVFNLYLNGTQSRVQIEGFAPYALFGDNAGVYAPWTPAVGSYTLKATPYTGNEGSGTSGTPLSINFSVVNPLALAFEARIPITTEEQVVNEPEANAFKVYPNPNYSGSFTVSLPKKLQGEVSYKLVSLYGARLTSGMLLLKKPTLSLNFNFSSQMVTSGAYYLIVEGKDLKQQLKLIYLK